MNTISKVPLTRTAGSLPSKSNRRSTHDVQALVWAADPRADVVVSGAVSIANGTALKRMRARASLGAFNDLNPSTLLQLSSSINMDVFNLQILDASIMQVASHLTPNQKADLLLYALRGLPPKGYVMITDARFAPC